jgi:exopolysaccharide biosynthesis polyprenyl glycosylphosphotransferase
MSRSRAATPSEIQAAAEPLAYTAITADGHAPESATSSSVRSESGSIAVPARLSGQRVKPEVTLKPRVHLPSTNRQGAFWRMRAILWTSDAVIAAVGAGAAVFTELQHVMWIAALWGVAIALRGTRVGRVADLSDLRSYTKFNVTFVLLATLVALFVPIFEPGLDGPRAVFGIAAGMAVAGYGVRRLLSRGSMRARLGIQGAESVLVVGSLDSVARTISEWEEIDRVSIVGVCLSEADFGPDDVKGVPVLGSATDVASLARRMKFDVVALHDVDKLGGLQLAKLQWALEDVGTQMSLITPMTNTVVDRARVRTVGRRVIVDVAYSRPSGMVAMIKGFVDRSIALLGLMIALPVLALCGLLIKVDSRGPVVFKQTRVRENGRTFTMYKLRTMTEDAEDRLEELLEFNEVGGGLFKMKADPRVTGVGNWLRRLSLDELPQLYNVLVGDMSLIGPRPALPSEVASYDQIARRRLAVKPGLTGLWQVSGRSNLSWDESVRIDHDYVDNWRPGRDLSIALRTVKAVLSKDGAV